MASPTRILKVRRTLAKVNGGTRRKKHDHLHGSTAPDLPLNQPNANEKAQLAAKENR